MIIKKYVCKKLSDAHEIIEKDLGPNAIILTTWEIKPKGILGWFGSPKIEVTAGVEDEFRTDQKSPGLMSPVTLEEQMASRPTKSNENNLVSVKHILDSFLAKEAAHPRHAKKGLLEASQGLLHHFSENSTETNGINQKIREIRGKKKSLLSFLESKGIAPSLASTLIANTMKRLGLNAIPEEDQNQSEIYNVLKREIAASINTSGPLLLRQGEPKIFALVGPTGVGKTTTIIKIALQYTQELKKNVGLITLDTTLIGTHEYINALALNFGLPLAKAETLEELQEAIRLFNDKDLILIDTCGRCPYQSQKINELMEILEKVDGIEVHLALSAATKDIDIIGAIKQFEMLNMQSLIFTKLDETIAQGALVNACVKTGKAISYLTNGQQIPGDLLIANQDEIARSLLIQNNAEEFDRLRQLANR